MPGKCAHEESRLTCIDCSAPLCGNCLVQCPVGFRCRACTGQGKIKPKSTEGAGAFKTLAVCAVAGYCAGWLIPFLDPIPLVGCIICFFLGSLLGNGLSRVIDYNLHGKLGLTVVFGLLIGMSLSPYGSLPVQLFRMLFATPEIFGSLYAAASMLFSPVCFFIGVLRATVWGMRF